MVHNLVLLSLYATNAIVMGYQNQKNDITMLQWIDTAKEKHYGFCIQAACQSFPGSILMIIAITYYQDVNYIYVISLLLSTSSIILKLLLFSQGIEIYSFLWTWLCVATDYFGAYGLMDILYS